MNEDQAEDMTPNVPEPADDKAYRTSWGKFLRQTFTCNIGLYNRVILPIGFFTVAVQESTVFALILAVMWAVTSQFALFGAHLKGWMEGVDWLEALEGEHSVNLSMVEFMNFCDEHDVPPQDVARLMWKEK